jgi:hypothetical protein
MITHFTTQTKEDKEKEELKLAAEMEISDITQRLADKLGAL